MKTPLAPAELAERVLRAVRDREVLVVEPARARAAWRLQRAAPALMRRMTAGYVAGSRRRRAAQV